MDGNFYKFLLDNARPAYLDGILLDAAKVADADNTVHIFEIAKEILKDRRLEHKVFKALAQNPNCHPSLYRRGCFNLREQIRDQFLVGYSFSDDQLREVFFGNRDVVYNEAWNYKRMLIMQNSSITDERKRSLYLKVLEDHGYSEEQISEFILDVAETSPRSFKRQFVFMYGAEELINLLRSKAMKLRKHALVRFLEDADGFPVIDRPVRYGRFKRGDIAVYLHSKKPPRYGRQYVVLGDDGSRWGVWRHTFEVIGYRGDDLGDNESD